MFWYFLNGILLNEHFMKLFQMNKMKRKNTEISKEQDLV